MSKVLGSRYGDESYFREGAELRQVPNKRLIADWAIRSEEEAVGEFREDDAELQLGE